MIPSIEIIFEELVVVGLVIGLISTDGEKKLSGI